MSRLDPQDWEWMAEVLHNLRDAGQYPDEISTDGDDVWLRYELEGDDGE